jgi:hypothetical protein
MSTRHRIAETVENGTHKVLALVENQGSYCLTIDKVFWPNGEAGRPLQEFDLSRIGLQKLYEAAGEALSQAAAKTADRGSESQEGGN